jgi:hypothetical protein
MSTDERMKLADRLARHYDQHALGDDYQLVVDLKDAIAALRAPEAADAEAVLKVVAQAYNEGFGEGMREHTSSRGGHPWSERKAYYETKLCLLASPTAVGIAAPTASADAVREIIEVRAQSIHAREHSHPANETVETDKWAMYRIRQELELLVAALSAPVAALRASNEKEPHA